MALLGRARLVILWTKETHDRPDGKAQARYPATAGPEAHGRDRQGEAELQPRPLEDRSGGGTEAAHPGQAQRGPGPRAEAGSGGPRAEAGRARSEARAQAPGRRY